VPSGNGNAERGRGLAGESGAVFTGRAEHVHPLDRTNGFEALENRERVTSASEQADSPSFGLGEAARGKRHAGANPQIREWIADDGQQLRLGRVVKDTDRASAAHAKAEAPELHQAASDHTCESAAGRVGAAELRNVDEIGRAHV